MIKYFVLDMDGCLTYPFHSPDWDAISSIRALQMRSGQEKHIPALSLCTGRPLPYAEAAAQWLGIHNTIIFESGGGFYHPVSNKLVWSPNFTEDIERKSAEIRKWFVRDVLPQFPNAVFEFSKRTDVGIVHIDLNEIKKIFEISTRMINDEFPEFEVHSTSISVNIIAKTCNKASGLQIFAERHDVTANEVAYIGDSTGDLKALDWVGMPFAPANAIEAVRRQACVMKGEATHGVLEAYRKIIDQNRSGSSSVSSIS